ncbi:hypothetical protein Nepgr_001797 [Nepenthes gracilis]|uniref:Rad21/Rec8-like protein N-terminal domain-containing protein n=1 Tax=Nepenthes gracilis TaxID=150966 RepID=A0AAD3RXV6_NEPGR|nr:hypothetical protein Nepgr_001797 [Nepenthes gracilis]
MFYSQFILAKKGPLGTIWIAAHLERKLRKNQVADTDIGVSVDSILSPEVPIALRLSSHLLLGVVRIYSRKVNYLFDDCSEALLKVKQAFRSTAVDLPPEESTAPYHSITLPETFDLDDFELPDSDTVQGNYIDHHFGLDERFGDGDTSQMGLDLDEELLLEKGATSRHGKVQPDSFIDVMASVEPAPLPEGDEDISEASKATQANCFNIQAPSTPILEEEPNLPSAQEAQVSDDHMDEDHNLSQLAAKEIFGAASSQPEVYHISSDDVLPPAKENVFLLDDQEIEKAIREGNQPLVFEPMEVVVSNNARLSLASEFISVSNDNVKNIQDENPSENEQSIASALQSKGEPGYAQEVAINRIDAQRNLSHAASVLELPGCDPFTDNISDKPFLNGFGSLVSSHILGTDKLTLEPGLLNAVEVDRVFQDNSSRPGYMESQAHLKPEQPKILSPGARERMLSASIPVLQACSSHLDDATVELDSLIHAPNLPSEDDMLCPLGISGREDATNIPGASSVVQDGLHGIAVMKATLKADRTPDLSDITGADHSNLDRHLDSAVSRDSRTEKENSAAISDSFSPEKLLSVVVVPANQSNESLVDSTPAKEVLAEGVGESAVNKISGQKRSYTESTLTLQSINSVESLGAAQSKKMVEFIPNDDDLLSSILVGRRSTVLKVRTTPSALDVVSAKRRRVASRPSPYKRKVLMDGVMVMHGDTIRQQLINTEDVRRVQKKAPCCRLEIWMLQKQLLEDEIFSKPLITGMSPELICLHSQPFDLSGTSIMQDEGSAAHSLTANNMEFNTRPGICEEPGFDRTDLPSVPGDDGFEQHAEFIEMTSNQPILKHSLDVDDNSAQKVMMEIDHELGHTTSQHNIIREKTKTEIYGRILPVGDEAHSSVVLGANLSSTGPVSSDGGILTNGAVIQSACLYEPNNSDASVQIEEMCQSLDQNFDLQYMANDASAHVDVSMVGISGGEGVDANTAEVLDKDSLQQRLEEGHFLDQMEGVDLSVTKAGIGIDCSLHVHDTSTFAATSSVDPENELGSMDKDQVLGSDLLCDDRGLSVDDHNGDLKLDSFCSLEGDLHVKNVISPERQNQQCQEADPQTNMDPTTIASEHTLMMTMFRIWNLTISIMIQIF